MVGISQIFRPLNPLNRTSIAKHLPMINDLTSGLNNYYGAYTQVRKKKALMNWYMRIPELTAFLNKISNDATSRWHFENINPNESGRNKILTANRFAQEISLNKVNNSTFIDTLITGDGFGWLGFLKNEDIEKAIKKVVLEKKELKVGEKKKLYEELINEIIFESKEFRKRQFEIKQVEGFTKTDGIDEDLLRPRKYRYVPSTTMEVVYNQYDILSYRHIVGLQQIEFKTDEIVHYTLMERDGKPYGFTPVESILVQLELLRQMWMNMLSLHRNGGYPDKVFAFENIQPNSPSYQRIEEQLQKYRLVENKHGNMLFTGKLTVHELQQIDDMQFKEQGLYVTGLLAMQWGIPRSSIPYIVGGANTKDDTGGNTERGYWEVIRNLQTLFSETQNTQLWMPHFGVKIIFDNPYVNLDVQQETAMMNKLNNIMSTDNILSKAGKQIAFPKRLRLLDMTEEEVEDQRLDIMQEQMAAQGMGTDAQLSPKGVLKTDGEQNVSKKKKKEQEDSAASKGVKPTGVGKRDDSIVETKMEFKEEKNFVPFETFIQLYNEDKAYHPGKPPRIMRQKGGMFTTYFFKSTDFVYATIVDNEGEDRIKFLNLGSKFYDI